jgi:hypothetical protein
MGHRTRTLFGSLLGLILVLPACSSSSSPAPATPPAAASTPAPVLWGDMKPVVSVKELMRYTIDPLADNIFDAVKTVVTKQGSMDTEPKTDEDWEKINIGAITLAESIYLLKVPRSFTPPGVENNSTGPDAVELSSAAIRAKVEKDPVEWNSRIEALRNVGLEVMDIVKRKDAKAMWDASENLDTACENCHRSYWYPGENAEFYKKLRDRLDDYRTKAEGSKK